MEFVYFCVIILGTYAAKYVLKKRLTPFQLHCHHFFPHTFPKGLHHLQIVYISNDDTHHKFYDSFDVYNNMPLTPQQNYLKSQKNIK